MSCVVESSQFESRSLSRCDALPCAVLCCREEGVNVSKCGRSVQPQPPPATRLGKIRLAKLAMRYTLLLPVRRCGPESWATVGQGKRTIYRLSVAVSYHLTAMTQ